MQFYQNIRFMIENIGGEFSPKCCQLWQILSVTMKELSEVQEAVLSVRETCTGLVFGDWTGVLCDIV